MFGNQKVVELDFEFDYKVTPFKIFAVQEYIQR